MPRKRQRATRPQRLLSGIEEDEELIHVDMSEPGAGGYQGTTNTAQVHRSVKECVLRSAIKEPRLVPISSRSA
jgi:hypothetical protein